MRISLTMYSSKSIHLICKFVLKCVEETKMGLTDINEFRMILTRRRNDVIIIILTMDLKQGGSCLYFISGIRYQSIRPQPIRRCPHHDRGRQALLALLWWCRAVIIVKPESQVPKSKVKAKRTWADTKIAWATTPPTPNF